MQFYDVSFENSSSGFKNNGGGIRSARLKPWIGDSKQL